MNYKKTLYNYFYFISVIIIFQTSIFRLGRRPVFYMSLVLIITGKVINLFLTRWYSWYSFGALIGALTQMPLFQTVMVIGMEISKR